VLQLGHIALSDPELFGELVLSQLRSFADHGKVQRVGAIHFAASLPDLGHSVGATGLGQ